MKQIQKWALAAAAAALILTACGEGATGDSAGGDTDGGDTTKNELTFVDTIYWANWQNQSIPAYQAGNVAHSLHARLVFNDVESGEIVPWLAEEFSHNDDYTEFTFTLREDVTFSDGTALDAAALQANFDLWGNGDEERGIISGLYFGPYDRTEIVDDRTVTVYLTDTYVHFLYALSSIFYGVQAPETLELSLEDQQNIENIRGAGPYVLDSYVADQEIVLKRRDDYAWAPESSENQGAAHIETLNFRYVPEISSRAGAVISGQADLARVIHPDDESRITDAGGVIHPALGTELTAYFGALRPDNPQVNEVEVRRALQHAVDIESILPAITTDTYVAPHGLFNASEEGVDLTVEFDLDLAKSLLDDAGWEPGSDGIREKNGVRLSIDTDDEVQSPGSLPIWEAIAQTWRTELGVELVIHKGDANYSRAAWYDPEVPLHPLRQWNYGGTASLFGGLDGNGFSVTLQETPDPAVLELARREATATDPEEQREIRAELNQYVIEEQAYVIPTYVEHQIFAGSEDLDISFTGATYPDFYNAKFK